MSRCDRRSLHRSLQSAPERRRRARLLRASLLLTLGAFACDGALTESIQDDGGPPVPLTIRADVGFNGFITVIAVEVTGPGIPVPIVANFEVDGETAEGTLTVPAGNDRVFTARAFDEQGAVTHEGSVTEDVRPGMSAVRIPLIPRGVGVPIETTVGSVQVAIDPGSATLELGETLQFTAAVTDAIGGAVDVDPSHLTWGSTNPAIVQVNASGLATAAHPGSAQVVVSYAGVAAAADVVVTDGTADPEPDPLMVSISPQEAYTGDTLVCSASGGHESGTFSYAWTVDAVSAGTGPTLPSSAFAKGQLVECQVTSLKEGEDPIAASTSVLILNSPPTVNPSITPEEPTPADTLTCSAGYADADGDPPGAILYEWHVNGTEAGTDPTLATGNFASGDEVSCTVTAADSDGAWSEPGTATVTIQ